MKNSFRMIGIVILIFNSVAIASPKRIILVRHADKLIADKAETGPYLSPQGIIRSFKLAQIIHQYYGFPDYLIASKPRKNKSAREIQTLMPLANFITEANHKSISILDPYREDQVIKMAHWVLTKPKFKDQTVLIAWHHNQINKIIRALGYDKPLPKREDGDFDFIVLLDYEGGRLSNYTTQYNQYPVQTTPSWQALFNRVLKND